MTEYGLVDKQDLESCMQSGEVVRVVRSTCDGERTAVGTMAECKFPNYLMINHQTVGLGDGRKCTEGASLKFIGAEEAIVQIETGGGRIVYQNDKIPIPYPRDFTQFKRPGLDKMNALRRACFGEGTEYRYLGKD